MSSVMKIQDGGRRPVLQAQVLVQPRSQGSLLPAPMERERETLENAGHVAPEQNYF